MSFLTCVTTFTEKDDAKERGRQGKPQFFLRHSLPHHQSAKAKGRVLLESALSHKAGRQAERKEGRKEGKEGGSEGGREGGRERGRREGREGRREGGSRSVQCSHCSVRTNHLCMDELQNENVGPPVLKPGGTKGTK